MEVIRSNNSSTNENECQNCFAKIQATITKIRARVVALDANITISQNTLSGFDICISCPKIILRLLLRVKQVLKAKGLEWDDLI